LRGFESKVVCRLSVRAFVFAPFSARPGIDGGVFRPRFTQESLMLRLSALPSRLVSALSLLLALMATAGLAAAQQILETYNDSLTTYLPSGNSTQQGVRPLHTQRGVNLDGSLRSRPGFPTHLQGNPYENAWVGQQYQGDLRVDVGAYAPTDVDIALPSTGISWVVGRTYNTAQQTSGSAAMDSNGYQGYNWFQTSQPEIVLFSGASADKDVLYLIYGADRFVEFQRQNSTSNQFKGKNGAAGCFDYATGSPQVYTYTDQIGNQWAFFGFNTTSHICDGQFWKVTDPASNVTFVGDSTTASTAITNGYNGDGRITTAYDASDRRYSYTYSGSAIGGTKRLTQVKAETKTGGTWTSSPTGVMTAVQADYDYHDGTDAFGSAGDLRKVTITTRLNDSGGETDQQIKKKYYRYWKGTYNSSTNPGYNHALKYVLDFEGTRRYDWQDSTFDEDFLADSDGSIAPYAAGYFEYDSNHKVRTAYFAGQCGCSGANNGTFQYAYAALTYTNNAGYDSDGAYRTVILRPDSNYETRYFDETSQGLSRVLSDGDPSGSPHTWITGVVRDSMGCVTEIDSPEGVTSYTFSTGAITPNSGGGLINTFVRIGSTNMKGFLSDKLHQEATGGTARYDGTWTWTSLSKVITDVTVVRPFIATSLEYPTETSSSGTGANTTSYSYTGYSGKLIAEVVTKTEPLVSTGNHGSNSSNIYSTHYRTDGLVDFEKAEDATIIYHGYTDGQQATLTQDANTTSLSPPTGFSHSGTPLDQATTVTYTRSGIRSQVSPPTGNVKPIYTSVLADERLVVLEFQDYASSTYYGPTRITIYNQAGKVELSGTVALSGNSTSSGEDSFIDETKSDPIQAVSTGTLGQMKILIYDDAGTELNEERTYFLIPGSGSGSAGTNYDATSYGYDTMGRRVRTFEASGTIYRTAFDLRNLVTDRYIGTDDYSFSGGSVSGPDDMVKTENHVYDAGGFSKNGYLTQRTLYVEGSSTNQRQTGYTNDYRGRHIVDATPIAPFALHLYDNVGREIALGQYSSTSGLGVTSDPTAVSTNRLALNETAFDEMGRVWKTTHHKINQSTGSDDDSITNERWYDERGRIIKVRGRRYSKMMYDRVGRETDRFALANDNDSAYADAKDVSGDIILEQRETRYDPTQQTVILRATISRRHSDIGGGETTGALDTNGDGFDLKLTGSNIKGRAQITSYWYDRVERETSRVEYGTNGGSDFDRSGLSVPASSATALRTDTAYNDDGMLLSITDPMGKVAKYVYDAEGRRTKEIKNYDAGVNSGNPYGTDQNVTVSYAYSAGLRTSLTAKMPSGGTDQVTTYTYGTTKGASAGDSKIGTGHLLKKITYPDSVSGSDEVNFAYNAQNQEIWKGDQGGNVIETDYDTLGHQTQKRVTTLGSGFDGAILRMASTFDSLGRASEVVQYDNATVGSGTAQDGVKYSYDDWGNVATYEEDRNSAVTGGGDQYATSYTWAKATNGRYTLRKSAMTMPDSRAITYTYRTSGGLHDDEESRVSTVVDGGSVTLAQYDYNGMRQVVGTILNEASVKWKQYDSSTPPNYPDLDRFDRVVQSRWTKSLASDIDFYSVTLTYDQDSNITSAKDNVHTGFDVNYTMDSVNRLTEAEEGTLSGGSIMSRTRDERWTLSHTGNWDVNKLDLNGNNNFSDSGELNDTRTHNVVNELIARDKDSDSVNDYSLTYDANGSMTDDGKLYTYVYDAFNRLRKIKNRGNSNLLAEYRYNGLGHRIGIHEDTDASGLVDSSDKWFYDAFDERWRVIARYRENDSSPKEDFVPHQAGLDGRGGSSYIDLVVCRNKDANTAWTSAADGTLEERLYYCQNWRADVSAIVTAVGSMEEWVKYSAYGLPFGLPGGDTNSTGGTDTTDVSQVQTWINGSVYDVRGDIDLNGTVDATDKSTIRNSFAGVTLARGRLSSTLVGNRNSYGGLEFSQELDLGNGRRRAVQGEAGRWTQRDPLSYVDSLNLYSLMKHNPVARHDPLGLTVLVRDGKCVGGKAYVQCLIDCLFGCSSTYRSQYAQLATSSHLHVFEAGEPDDPTADEGSTHGEDNDGTWTGGSQTTIDPNSGDDSPDATLAHETYHAGDFDDHAGCPDDYTPPEQPADNFGSTVDDECGCSSGGNCPQCDSLKPKPGDCHKHFRKKFHNF
jgi:RHS repeat-associated protein